MKDQYDDQTLDYFGFPVKAQPDFASKNEHEKLAALQKNPSRCPKPFDVFRSVLDEKTFAKPKPKCARTVLVFGIEGGNFVPVSFAAKDWNVTPRRIRALLSGGRLAGRLQHNGYWEVRYPYQFAFGTRGPSLKRQQRPEKRPKKASGKPALIAV